MSRVGEPVTYYPDGNHGKDHQPPDHLAPATIVRFRPIPRPDGTTLHQADLLFWDDVSGRWRNAYDVPEIVQDDPDVFYTWNGPGWSPIHSSVQARVHHPIDHD